MDYLTILSTRSLILFPTPSSLPLSPSLSSPLSSPSTPTVTLLRPEPVAMPLSSLLHADTRCAYFLIHHVLSTTQPFYWSSPDSAHSHLPALDHEHDHEHDYGYESVGRIDKETSAEVEVMVWKEIDRAKMFARALGKAIGALEHGQKLGEDDLRGLAARYGLGIESEQKEKVAGIGAEMGTGMGMEALSVNDEKRTFASQTIEVDGQEGLEHDRLSHGPGHSTHTSLVFA